MRCAVTAILVATSVAVILLSVLTTAKIDTSSKVVYGLISSKVHPRLAYRSILVHQRGNADPEVLDDKTFFRTRFHLPKAKWAYWPVRRRNQGTRISLQAKRDRSVVPQDDESEPTSQATNVGTTPVLSKSPTATHAAKEPKTSRGDITVVDEADDDYDHDEMDSNRGGPSPLSGRHAAMPNPSLSYPSGNSFDGSSHHDLLDSHEAFSPKIPSATNQQPVMKKPSQGSTLVMTLGSVGAALVIILGAAVVWRKRRASRNSLKVVPPPKIMVKSPSSPNLTTNAIPFVLPYVSIPPLRQSCMSDDESSKKNLQNRNRRIGIAQPQPPILVGCDYDGVDQRRRSSHRVSTCSRDFLTVDRYDRNLFDFYPAAGLSEDEEPSALSDNVVSSGIPHSESGNSIGIGLGRIGFTLSYCLESEELKVFLIGASNLPAKAKKGSVDPFVRVTCIPDKHPKFSTKIKRNSLSPSFEEEFTFTLRRNYLDGKTLKLKICDYDKFSRTVVIGYATFPLKDAGIQSGISGDTRTGEIWRDIQDTVEFDMVRVSFGEVLLCLKYDPNSGLLSIDVIQARELKFQKESTASMNGDAESSSSVYAKIILFEGKRVIKSKKTDVRKNTRDPIFNENFSIHVPRSYLSDIFADVSLWHKGRLGRKRMIGKAQVGPFTYVSGTGMEQWEDMLHQPNTKVSQWHSLHQ